MKITACSIVKNEAKNIARSIQSYKDAVDEIIIVDTGSTDNTVEISESYGAKVLHFTWNNSFADAKNFAIEHATGNWIIFLDADEWFVPALKRNYIMNIIKQADIKANSTVEGFIFIMKQIDISKREECFVTDGVSRIFRNLPDIRYKGSIHERIKRGDRELILARCADMFLYHSGYSSELLEQKARRNLELLNNAYNNGEKDTILYFFLVRENYSSHNYHEAMKFVELFQSQDDMDYIIENYSSAICFYEYAYGVMKNLPEIVTIEDIEDLLKKAFEKYPELPTHSYLKGREAMDHNSYDEAELWLEKALELNKSYSNRFSNSFPSYISDTYFKIGLINQQKNKHDTALTNYVNSLKFAVIHKYATILQNVLSIIGKESEKEIIIFINSILDVGKKEVVEAILAALRNTRLHKVFLYYALKYNKEFDGQNENTYIAMILSGQVVEEVETAMTGYINASKESENIINGGDNSKKVSDYKWHLDYGLIGLLYCKNADLYEHFKDYFSDKQKCIIEAFIYNRQINNVSQEVIDEACYVLSKILFLFTDEDTEKFKRIFDIVVTTR